MKKLLLSALFAVSVSVLFAQTDTIIGFTFPGSSDLPTFGLSGNLGYNLLAEDNSGTTRILTYTNGQSTGDTAATCDKWHNGANEKFWSIKFKANGYSNFKLSSKQRSGGTNAGPADWKLQYKIGSSGIWTDIPGGTITVANNWTQGVVSQLDLPSDLSTAGTQSIFVRWIMTSNNNSSGGTVDSLGISKIDDIYITASIASGAEVTLFDSEVTIYPNPSEGAFHLTLNRNFESILIFDMAGRIVYSVENPGLNETIDLNGNEKGLYMIRLINEAGNTVTRKIVLQ